MDKGQSSSGPKKQSKTTETSKKKKSKKGAKSVEEVKDTKSNDIKSTVVEVNSTAKKPDATASSQSKSGQQNKTKTTENSKKKNSKKSAKTVEAVKGTNSNKVENNVDNVEKRQSSTAKYATTDAGIQVDSLSFTSQQKQHKEKGATKTKIESKSGNISKDLSKQKDLDTKFSKASETLPAIESFSNDEAHSLDYSPEAVLIAAEENLHGGSKSKDIGVSDLADMDVGSAVTPGFQSKAESHIESEPEQHFEEHSEVSEPRTFREGTPGGRLFKEETLAEIDAYLYLGKVSL